MSEIETQQILNKMEEMERRLYKKIEEVEAIIVAIKSGDWKF